MDTTTLTYKETPYADETYEIVGPPPIDDEFLPLAIDIIRTDAAKTDEMFANFGGSIQRENEHWHLPQGVVYVSEDTERAEQEKKEAARREIEQRIEAAYARGLEDGKQQGRTEAEASMTQRTAEMTSQVGAVMNDLQAQIGEELARIEREAVKLSLNIAEKIIPQAVEINPEYVVKILHEALSLAGTSVIKCVRVSPADLEFINVVGLQKNIASFDGTWEFVADDTIRAGCVVETSAGDVEYDLDKAWARMKDGIVKVMR